MDRSSSTLETAVGPIVTHMQADTFCDGCGYNLNTQAVMRDDRLGILVCRCPECGRYAAAGQATSASRIWLNRLGTMLLLVWVLFLVGLFALGTLGLGGLAYGELMTFVRFESLQLQNPKFPGQNIYGYQYVLRTPAPDRPEEVLEMRLEAAIICGVGAALAFLLGSLYAVFLWHCKRWRRYLALLMPVLACGGAAISWASDVATQPVRAWGLERIPFFLILEIAAMLLGLYLGRPIARGLLKIFLPPKPRQHLAFLWLTDGKRMAV